MKRIPRTYCPNIMKPIISKLVTLIWNKLAVTGRDKF